MNIPFSNHRTRWLRLISLVFIFSGLALLVSYHFPVSLWISLSLALLTVLILLPWIFAKQ